MENKINPINYDQSPQTVINSSPSTRKQNNYRPKDEKEKVIFVKLNLVYIACKLRNLKI
jgi:hypothetical protein